MSLVTPDFLLIDISNSFTKIAFATKEKLFRIMKIPTAALSAPTLRALLGKRDFRRAIVCSVVPEKEKAVLRFLRNHAVLRVSVELDLGVAIDYPNPASIGADRLANAARAADRYGAPVVVVDFGTAVTFDILARGRKYIGGVICPGLNMMTEYLSQRTALLPKITLREPVSVIGRSTREAMLAGAVFGYRGLVREVLSEIKREISPRSQMQVIATGGYAELIARGLPEIDRVDPTLTLDGIRIIGVRNE